MIDIIILCNGKISEAIALGVDLHCPSGEFSRPFYDYGIINIANKYIYTCMRDDDKSMQWEIYLYSTCLKLLATIFGSLFMGIGDPLCRELTHLLISNSNKRKRV